MTKNNLKIGFFPNISVLDKKNTPVELFFLEKTRVAQPIIRVCKNPMKIRGDSKSKKKRKIMTEKKSFTLHIDISLTDISKQ